MKLRYIFISIFAVLLMSHNAFATTANIAPPNMRVHRVQRNNFSNSSYENYTFNTKNDRLGFAVAVVGKDWSIRSISLPLGRTIKSQSYYTMTLTLVNSYLGTLAGMGCNKIDDVSYVQGTTSDTTIYISGHLTCDVTSLDFGDNNNPNMVLIHGTTTQEGIWVFQPKINFFDYQDQAAESLKEAQKDTQEAADNSKSEGNSSTSEASSATNSLISVIGQFVGAVTTASPSNCLINGNMGKVNMGQIDLCANPVPTFVQIISSLILIAICVPFAIIMFNRFINLFRSFQG